MERVFVKQYCTGHWGRTVITAEFEGIAMATWTFLNLVSLC